MAKATCDEIRVNAAAGDSEEYDLAGFTQQWCYDLVNDCLGQVLPAKDYVGCRFVIGGGKKTRQKYDADMLKNMSFALKEAGYTEDRGASACKECMVGADAQSCKGA